MKTAVLYVFTGTGNTLTAANLLAQELDARGVSATVCRVRAPFSDVPDPNDFDLCGFGYPIHAFNTPQFFLRFAGTLPQVQNKPAFVFKTSGEPFAPNHASSRPLVRILRRKGFAAGLDTHMLMPYNIMFRYRDAMAKQMYAHTQGMAKVIADRAVSGDWDKLRYHPVTVVWMMLLRLQWFGAWINGPLIHADTGKCVGCGICANNCPARNITMRDGVPHFSYHCTMCMSCAFRCPKDAVRPGILNPWRVNGAYPFQKLAGDESVPATYVNENTRGYFRLFRPYYRRTYAEIARHEEADAGK